MTAPAVPLPRPLTDDDLAALARITERDRVEAEDFWRRFGVPLVRACLHATDAP